VRIVVGFTAGGNLDMIARLMGQWLSERLGPPFVIENRPGAGTNIATETVVRAPADGYTLLMVGPTQAINATLYDKLNFNFIHDIAPVVGIISTANVMVVNPSVPAKTVPDFIAYAKANPHKVNMASGGTGAPSHIAGELFKMMTGIDMLHVPYRGGAPALTDLMGGQLFWPHYRIHRAHQGWQAARARRNHRYAFGGAAGHPHRRRICAGLRGEHLVRRRGTEGHAGRDRRQAQQRVQCGPRRSQD
jgi:tripartite-type tricarboxylate transporter receptor subunit TctC